jgi:hypothetical protein
MQRSQLTGPKISELEPARFMPMQVAVLKEIIPTSLIQVRLGW